MVKAYGVLPQAVTIALAGSALEFLVPCVCCHMCKLACDDDQLEQSRIDN